MIKHLSPKTKKEIFRQWTYQPFKEKVKSICRIYDDTSRIFKTLLLTGMLIISISIHFYITAFVIAFPLMAMVIDIFLYKE